MDPILVRQTLMTLALDVLTLAIFVPLVKRMLGRRLDEFDAKREEARTERARRLERDERWQSAMTAGMRSMLRSELIGEHRKWMPKGYCPLESKEYIRRTYTAYHALDGNDIGTSLYSDVMGLPNDPMDKNV